MRRSESSFRGLRPQLTWPQHKPFRILSIDGGGIRGILPAAILAELERRYTAGRSAGDFFDLIVGTSTGGIIALALANGLPAREILTIYMKHGGEVFPPLKGNFLRLRQALRGLDALGHHRYNATALESHLRSVFGNRTIGMVERRLCIPSFDGFTETYIFKTPHHPHYGMDWKEFLLTAAMATAAAPTFLPIYKSGDRVFADGGVWALNPVMIGLVDALSCYTLDRRQVQILSLGAGDSEIPVTSNQISRGGKIHWRNIISSAMHLQSQNADGQAGLLVGRDNLLRMNFLQSNPMDMDDYLRSCEELPCVALELVGKFGEQIRSRFLREPSQPFVAFHGPRASADAVSIDPQKHS